MILYKKKQAPHWVKDKKEYLWYIYCISGLTEQELSTEHDAERE
jgi:hypothetical protein